MSFSVSFQSYLSDEEFEKCKYRLTNVLLLNQYRLFQDKNIEIERRIHQSKTCGSLCLDKNDLPLELWLNYNQENFMISNYGRVKYGSSIVPQMDYNGKNGWLVLDNEKFGKYISNKYIYNMVAETFFSKPNDKSYQVHHITNNGYDNSIGNLIYLTNDQHKKVEKPVQKYMNWK